MCIRDSREDLASLTAMVKDDLDPNDVVPQDQLFILRFLLSHEHTDGLSAAADALRRTVAWRREMRDQLHEWHSFMTGGAEVGKRECHHPDQRKFAAWWVGGMHNYTTYMEPVSIVRAGLLNPQAIRLNGLTEEVLAFMRCYKEQLFAICDQASRETGRLVKFLEVLDFQNFGLRTLDRIFLQQFGEDAKSYEDFYPQLLRANVVANPPMIMSAIWKISKLFLPKRSADKTIFCGSDATKCPFLQDQLPYSELPTFLGGDCRCNSAVGGECIALTTNDQCELSNCDQMVKINVPAGRQHVEVLRVDFEGTIVNWSFELEARGIEFAVVFIGDGSDAVDVVPLTKFKAEDGKQEGKYTSPHPGSFSLTFNNDYSMIRSKDVRFSLEVLN
eukprot:TRINITY_DN34869_c0_g1_i1.p1 TRINITY_DN34869_c0_g1~~TRINITY_DN34869_c0_g1_i1.p1  ORF type:complete len:399 (+),score=89.73 TRINITY_DN34869_c0_g1_i1:34-1197(+)